MHRLPDPPCLARYAAMGGVLDIARFGACDGSDAELREAIAATVAAAWPTDPGIDRDRLAALPCRPLTREVFLGDWADRRTGDLVHRGTQTMTDGRTLHHPTYRALDALEQRGITSRGSSSQGVELWAGGEFAYAFAQPPYTLRAPFGAIQALFEEMVAMILPPGQSWSILDWGSEALPAISAYFQDGLEWWGVFLFTVHVPAERLLTVIAGSTTD